MSDILYVCAPGSSPKKAFLNAKEKSQAWSLFSSYDDDLALMKRYQIIDTNVQDINNLIGFLQTASFSDFNLKRNCMGCYILEDDHYLFFYKKVKNERN